MTLKATESVDPGTIRHVRKEPHPTHFQPTASRFHVQLSPVGQGLEVEAERRIGDSRDRDTLAEIAPAAGG
jgi:hypothetical protein